MSVNNQSDEHELPGSCLAILPSSPDSWTKFTTERMSLRLRKCRAASKALWAWSLPSVSTKMCFGSNRYLKINCGGGQIDGGLCWKKARGGGNVVFQSASYFIPLSPLAICCRSWASQRPSSATRHGARWCYGP